MIQVKKDYNNIPRVLLSDDIEKRIEKFRNGEIKSSHLIPVYNEIKQNLNEIYHGKCAYCESKLYDSSMQIDQHRPKSKYPWLAYEWSNLLPACHTCNISKSSNYPIKNDVVSVPPINKKDWRYDLISLQEEPLLLNPEYDNPEEHLSFYSDGRIFGLTERGRKTIDILKLNRQDLILKRVNIVNSLKENISFAISNLKNLIDEESLETEKSNSLMKLAFDHLFKDLLSKTDSKAEYSQFCKYLFNNFEEIFIDNF